MKKEMLLGIIVLLMLFAAFLIFQKSPPTIPPKDTIGISVLNNHIKETSATNYEINVSYPQVEGLSDKTAEKTINTSVENTLKKNIEEFKKNVADAQNNTKLPPQLKNGMNQYIVTFDTAQTSDTIASFHFTIFQSTVGMAHPLNSNMTFTYDISKNSVINIRSLFKPNSNYLARLSDLSRKSLTSQITNSPFSKMMIQEGTTPVESNFSLFTLSKDYLTLYFNPSQVATDASGTQLVKIPLKDLSDILNITQ